MNNRVFLRILIAAILLGGFFGAVVTLVPQFTASADSGTRLIIDSIVAVIAGIVFLGYIRFVNWERKRSSRDS